MSSTLPSILRTADLLHITSDRTPSVLFRLIAPSDPISQQEWAKQAAVTAVRAKPGVDAEGNVDNEAPRDTIEVVAQFTDEEGFFGLTAYLTYAGAQLRQTFDWAEEASRRHGSKYKFPWKHIDESQILTSGFLRDSFEFSLDTRRVLDLLTGHTLYNNTSVVLREIVQNSLDAIRAQRLDHPDLPGSIFITWDTAKRNLTVRDNGTGMSQSVIERHLLRVGSSRYQDPEFQRQHPDFSQLAVLVSGSCRLSWWRTLYPSRRFILTMLKGGSLTSAPCTAAIWCAYLTRRSPVRKHWGLMGQSSLSVCGLRRALGISRRC